MQLALWTAKSLHAEFLNIFYHLKLMIEKDRKMFKKRETVGEIERKRDREIEGERKRESIIEVLISLSKLIEDNNKKTFIFSCSTAKLQVANQRNS
jgi:hypothetical protein